MIKFFRKIRFKSLDALIESSDQRLLTESKFSKYLIYAIGEIVLVMIGILLALQVNNWNEVRKDNNSEQFILKNLYQDFRHNQEEIQEKIQATNLSDEGIKSIIQLFKNKHDDNLKGEQIDSLINYLFIKTSFDPKMTTINELVNNGKLTVVQNQQLRDIINGWGRDLAEVTEIEERLQTVTEMLINYLKDKYAMADVYFKNGTWRKIEYSSSFDTNKKEVFQDMEFENIISTKSHYHKYLIRRYESIEKRIETILRITEQEMK